MATVKLKYKYLPSVEGAQEFYSQYLAPLMGTMPSALGQLQTAISQLPSQGLQYSELGGRYLSDVLGGVYLTPQAISSIYEPIAQQYREELGRALGDIRSKFALAGTPESSAAGLAMAQAAEGSLADLNALMAQILQAERTRQQQMLPLALQYSLLPYQRLSAMTEMQSAIPSILAGYGRLWSAFQPQLLATWATEPSWYDYLAGGLGGILTGLGGGFGYALGRSLG